MSDESKKVIYEIFAVSEEGTETVETTEDYDEAVKTRIRLLKSLENKTWVNSTSLHNIVGFNIDSGPSTPTIVQ